MSFARLLAYYLPQFHPFPENDQWFGKGFTEWTNVAKAKPLFKGHYQPRLPADLGFYDLRVPEIMNQQAELAKNAGIEGFIYYHYWFGNGKRLMDYPLRRLLETKTPDFPFMLCWANHSWKGAWSGVPKGQVLMEQKYLGSRDDLEHFKLLRNYFEDERYIKVDGKPAIIIFRPEDIPHLEAFTDTWREAAQKAGFKGLYLIAGDLNSGVSPQKMGMDAVISNNFDILRRSINQNFFLSNSIGYKIESRLRAKFNNANPELRNRPIYISYENFLHANIQWPNVDYDYFPQIIPDWDNSARAGKQSLILKGSTPELWKEHIKEALNYSSRYSADKNIVFIKSWNEWAEGNYLEPDQKWGHAYLDALRETLHEFKQTS